MNTEKSPKVSVIMPVYNTQKYVAEAIESILNQTFKDFEFIIIDDGSTDKSLQIIKKYALKDKRIKIISRANKGIARTRNEGLELAKGEYIVVMDSDDISLPERFEKQMKFLDENKDIVCVGGAFDIIDSKGRFLRTAFQPQDDKEIQERNLKGQTAIDHPCSMIRLKSIKMVGGYDSKLIPAEDLDLWLKLGEIGKLSNLGIPVLKHRYHSKSISELKIIEQNKNRKLACEYAWKRRGIKGKFDTEVGRSGKDKISKHKFAVMYGWWAFNSKETKTALIYGLKAITILPFKLEGWNLFLTTIKKQIFGLK